MRTTIYLMILTTLLAASCSRDSFGDVLIGENETALDINVRSANDPANAGAILQSDIATLDIVVVKNGAYSYKRSAYKSEYADFRSALQIDSNLDLYFFANCGHLLTDDIMVEGRSWEEIRSEIILEDAYVTIAGKTVLPMWGQSLGTDITDNRINEISVNLLRAVAAANVIFDLDPLTSLGFTPKKAYVYFGADKAYVAPVTQVLKTDNGQVTGVTKPVSPSSMATTQGFVVDAVNGAFVNSIFMLENDADSGVAAVRQRTRLVIGGLVDGSSEMTYFPLDFSHTDSGEVLKVTRNSKYNLRITAVKGEGWPDPDTASGSAKADIDYEVVDWNESDHDNLGVDGPDYLSVSTKTVKVGRTAGSKGKVKLSGTFNKEDISIAFAPTSPNGAGTKVQDGIENERFRVILHDAGSKFDVVVTALCDYSTIDPSLNNDTFTIKAGRIIFDIEIEQVNDGGWSNGGDEEIDF